MSLLSRLFRKAPPPSLPPERPSRTPEPRAPEPSIAILAAQTAKDEEALRAALKNRDFRAVGELVTQGSSTKIRQQAAEAIEDPVQIRELIKAARGGNDKSVYKILARKRDALVAQERERDVQQAEVNAAATALERHSHRAWDALFAPTLQQLEARWKAVAINAEPALVEKMQSAIDRARETIAQHLRNIAAQASRELAAANAAAEAQRQREEEQKAAAIVAAERAEQREAERKALAEKREAEALFLRQVGGLLRKALGALNDGSTSRAAGLRRALEEKLTDAPALPPHLANQLVQLDAKLNELKDWKSFSVAPKRSELIEEMESLIDATIDPPVLAERIKTLQEDWRTLSKGAGENEEAEWQRFQEAAKKAYQPCREYFEAQSRVRQENLQKREELCERLAAFESQHNWEQPDWRKVLLVLRESKQEWRQYSPVDRSAGNVLQERFRALSVLLQDRMDAEHTRNVQEKKNLIAAAERLLTLEDNRNAIDDLKNLQQRWKSVGPVPRDQDQSLWEEFRRQCDAVFQKRQQKLSERNSELEAHKAKAVELCEALEKIASLSGAEMLESAKQLPDIRNAFEAVGELPREVARALLRRFERAVEQCEKSIARQQAREGEQRWSSVFDAANAVRAYRLAVIRNAEAAEQESLKQAAEGAITAIGKGQKSVLEALKSALTKTGDSDLAANERALRMLCIRAEILTDAPTPLEDQALRREHQMQRLIENMGQGMGEGAAADAPQLNKLAVEWIGVGPTEEATYLPLMERFVRCRQLGNS